MKSEKTKLYLTGGLLVVLCVGLISFAVYTLYSKKSVLTKTSVTEIKEMINNGDKFVLEIASTTCGACTAFRPTIEKVVKDNDIKVYVIYTDKISESDREELFKTINFVYTPTVTFFDGGVESFAYRIEGNASYDKVVSTLKKLDYIKDPKISTVTVGKVSEMVNNGDKFILEITSSSCEACTEFKPTLEKVVNDNELTIYAVDIDKLSESDKEQLFEIVNFNSTPTLAFFDDGTEEFTYRITGNTEYNNIVSTLKKLNYIK